MLRLNPLFQFLIGRVKTLINDIEKEAVNFVSIPYR